MSSYLKCKCNNKIEIINNNYDINKLNKDLIIDYNFEIKTIKCDKCNKLISYPI